MIFDGFLIFLAFDWGEEVSPFLRTRILTRFCFGGSGSDAEAADLRLEDFDLGALGACTGGGCGISTFGIS